MKKCKNKGCFDSACTRQGYCRTHSPPANNRSYEYRPSPGDMHQLGVEMECFATDGRDFAALTNVAEFCCNDGSLPEYGTEIKLCTLDKDMPRIAADVGMRARLAGGRVSRKCGLHVHMDFRDAVAYCEHPAVLKALENWLKMAEDMFFSAMPSARRDSTYVRRLSDDGITSHYSWINISKKCSTLELRTHPGTLNPHKLIAWTKLCTQFGSLARDFVIDAYRKRYGGEPKRESYPDWKDIPFTGIAKNYLKSRIQSGGRLATYAEVEDA